MKKDYTFKILLTIAIAVFFKIALFAAGKGYLITLDEKYITGNVISVNNSETGNELIFVNDFGDYYRIHPFLIKGFVFKEKEQTIQYMSKFNGDDWLFLRVEEGGAGMRLYRSNSTRVISSASVTGFITKEVNSGGYWIEMHNTKPFQVYGIGFRGKMRRALKDYPELAQKIGEKGYRFKNLRTIVKEYNEWYEATRIMM